MHKSGTLLGTTTMRKMLILTGTLLIWTVAATAGTAPLSPVTDRPAYGAEDNAVTGRYASDERLYRKCRRKVRRYYGSARGRHVKSLRIAYTQRCVAAGGRLN